MPVFQPRPRARRGIRAGLFELARRRALVLRVLREKRLLRVGHGALDDHHVRDGRRAAARRVGQRDQPRQLRPRQVVPRRRLRQAQRLRTSTGCRRCRSCSAPRRPTSAATPSLVCSYSGMPFRSGLGNAPGNTSAVKPHRLEHALRLEVALEHACRRRPTRGRSTRSPARAAGALPSRDRASRRRCRPACARCRSSRRA